MTDLALILSSLFAVLCFGVWFLPLDEQRQGWLFVDGYLLTTGVCGLLALAAMFGMVVSVW